MPNKTVPPATPPASPASSASPALYTRKARVTRLSHSQTGFANGAQLEACVIEVPGAMLPPNAEIVPGDTPLSDWAPVPVEPIAPVEGDTVTTVTDGGTH